MAHDRRTTDRRTPGTLAAAFVFAATCTVAAMTAIAVSTLSSGPPAVTPIHVDEPAPASTAPATTAPTTPAPAATIVPATTPPVDDRAGHGPGSVDRAGRGLSGGATHRTSGHGDEAGHRSARHRSATTMMTPTAMMTTTTAMMTTTVAAMTTGDGRLRWGIRRRVVAASVALLAGALAVMLLVTWLALVNRLERDIDDALAQEVEELRQLATGVDPRTGELFGTDARAIFDTFLNRNVPSDSEAYYSYVDGRFFLASFGAPIAIAREQALTATWTAADSATWGTTSTSVGEIRYLATPVITDRGTIGVFVVVHFPADDRGEVARVIRTAALAGATVLVIAAAAAWSMAGRVLRPIRELTATAQGITATDLSAADPGHGRRRARRAGRDLQRDDRPPRGSASRPNDVSSTTSRTSCALPSPSCTVTSS